MKRFLIACSIILILLKIEFSESGKKTIRGLQISEMVELWKNATHNLNLLQKMFSNNNLPKGEPIPEEMQGLRTLMKFIFALNKQVEEQLDKVSSNSSSETSHESQQWEQSLRKSIKRVHTQIENFMKSVGFKPFDQSSTEELVEEIRKNYRMALGLTLLLRNSKLTLESRMFKILQDKIIPKA